MLYLGHQLSGYPGLLQRCQDIAAQSEVFIWFYFLFRAVSDIQPFCVCSTL